MIVDAPPKYAYRNRDGVIETPAPSHIIESGIPTEALSILAVSKYADGLAALSAGSHLCAGPGRSRPFAHWRRWTGKVGFELGAMVDHVLERIKQGERVFADETNVNVGSGSGKTERPGHGPMPV